jgi:hypothetical protein
MNALCASVNQMQQQMSFLLQTQAATLPQRARVKNECVKDEPGLRTTTQDQHVDLVTSTDDSCDSEACATEDRQKPSLSEQEPPPKKMKFNDTAGNPDTHVDCCISASFEERFHHLSLPAIVLQLLRKFPLR